MKRLDLHVKGWALIIESADYEGSYCNSTVRHIDWQFCLFSLQDILLDLVILCLLHAVHSSYTLEDCRSSNTSAVISVNYDNYQITVFDSLQEALDFVKSNNNSQPTICLPPGTHIVSNQIQFGQKSLRLIGSENTTVRCDYDPLPVNEGIDYTWHLNRSEFFCLSGIHFSSCPYPYRVIAVKEVTVRNCTFM